MVHSQVRSALPIDATRRAQWELRRLQTATWSMTEIRAAACLPHPRYARTIRLRYRLHWQWRRSRQRSGVKKRLSISVGLLNPRRRAAELFLRAGHPTQQTTDGDWVRHRFEKSSRERERLAPPFRPNSMLPGSAHIHARPACPARPPKESTQSAILADDDS